MHIFRWDVDKTYLETSFSSFRGLLRTALESAKEKRNVPGSAALLRSLIASNPDCRVTVISGSPTQMRGVLEEKFAIDGVEIDELILKDNLRNIRKGKFKAVTNQIGYKLPVLFQQRRGLGQTVTETLFGDDTEADALIYALYAHALAGGIDATQISRVMAAMGTPHPTIQMTLDALKDAGQGRVVEHVFIRIHRGLPIRCYRKLGPEVIPVFSWFQAALVLLLSGRLDTAGFRSTLDACIASDNMAPTQMGFLIQDTLRRELVDGSALKNALASDSSFTELIDTIERVEHDLGEPRRSSHTPQPDYLGFVKDIQRKH